MKGMFAYWPPGTHRGLDSLGSQGSVTALATRAHPGLDSLIEIGKRVF